MSKRPTPAWMSSSKRPKLDIMVNSQSCNNYNKPSTSHQKTNNDSSKTNQEDIWGDDLDADAVEECIYVATQLTQQAPDPNTTELPSFTEFRPPQMCSTQMSQSWTNNHVTFKSKAYENNKINQIGQGKNQVLTAPSTSNMASTSNFKSNTATLQNSKPNAYIAKMNAPIYCRPTLSNNNLNFNTQNIRNFNRQGSGSLMNGNHFENGAEELEARLHNVNDKKYLMKELDNVKAENDRLKLESGKAMDRFLTKEGEVTILRSQLATSKALAESLRMERIQLIEKTRMQYEEQLAARNKQVNDLLAQLQFKELEITNARDRCRLLESKKIRLTEPQSQKFCDVSHFVANSPKNPREITRHEKKLTNTTSVQTSQNFEVHIDDEDIVELPLLQIFPKELYDEYTQESEKIKIAERKNFNHRSHECISVRSILPEVYMLSKLTKKQLQTNLNIQGSLNKVICITKELSVQVCASLKNPTEQLQKQLSKKYKNCDVDEEYTIFQAKPCHNEIFVELRRCLAIAAVLIEHCPYLTKFLQDISFDELINYDLDMWFLEHRTCFMQLKDERNILTILLDILDNLPEIDVCVLHEPLLLSITEFMISCYKTISHTNTLKRILMNLVFSKSPAKVTHRIASLLEFLSLKDTYLEILCVDSEDQLALDFKQGVYVFSTKSCFLQVYAVTLETCVNKSYLQQEEYKKLHTLTSNVINFVHNSMNNDLSWTYPQKHCDCYISIMKSIVVLLHFCVEQHNSVFARYENLIFMTSLGRVLRLGILTLYQLLMRDPEQPILALQLGYFGGRFLSVVNFACDFKDVLFPDDLHREFVEQVSKDLLFYHTLPSENLNRTEIWESTFDGNLDFNLSISDT